MPLGQFTLEIKGQEQDGTAENKARLHLTPQGPDTLLGDDDFKFPSKFAKADGVPISIPFDVDLFTDTASGEGDSETIGYEGWVATDHDRVPFQFAAPEAGETLNLRQAVDREILPLSDLRIFRDEAEAAAAAAAASATSVNREQSSGVAGLTAAGKLYEVRIPDRLSEVALGATYAARVTGQTREGDALPKATAGAGITLAAVPKGTYARPVSIGVDGAVYTVSSNTQLLRSTDSMGTNFPAVVIDFSGVAGYTAGDGLIYATRTTAGYVAVTSNGDTGKIWFTSVAAGTSGWTVVQATTKAIQSQAIAKPQSGPDGKTLLLFGEYGTTVVARKLWMSRDGGATWTNIKTTSTNAASPSNSHFHGVCYDPDMRRIWASEGDDTNAKLSYSDDFGVSWVQITSAMAGSEATAAWPSQSNPQPLALAKVGNKIIATNDGVTTACVWEIDKFTGRFTRLFTLPTAEIGFQQFGYTVVDGVRGPECYIAFVDTGSLSRKTYLVGTGDGGRTWAVVASFNWNDGTGSVGYFVGPDPFGYVFHKPTNSTQHASNTVRGLVPTYTWKGAGS